MDEANMCTCKLNWS